MTGLAPIDGMTVLAILLKALDYGAALLAVGGVFFTFLFASHASRPVLEQVQRLALWAAVLGTVVLALRFGVRAARISGMGFDGAIDPLMLGFVWESPLGTAAILRGLGLIGVLALLFPGAGRLIALGGSISVAVSYVQVGHTLGDPRAPLAILLTVHLLAVAVWVGALVPLWHATKSPEGAAVLQRFGQVAAFAVGALIFAGILLTWLLSGSLAGLFGTAYGLGLLSKVVIVSGLLGLAALNKWRLVPAFREGQVDAAQTLQRSITFEVVAVAAILVATATITTVTTPPANL